MDEEVHSRVAELMRVIDEHPKAIEFRKPVDWQAFGLTDYPELIKNPMDIGTVIEKLDKGSYKNLEAWFNDISLVFNNCK